MPASVKAQNFTSKPGIMPILLMPPYGPGFLEVIEKLSTDDSLQVVECDSSLTAVSAIQNVDKAMILCFASSPQDMVKHITLMKLLQTEIQSQRVRPVVVTDLKQVNILSLLSIYGVSEIIPEDTPPKALVFKLHRHIRATLQAKANVPGRRDGGAEARRKAAAAAKAAGESKIRYVDPIALASDYWALEGGSIKKMGGKWIVKLRGPSPNLGNWFKVESASGGVVHWQWRFHDENRASAFMRDEGSWIFRGQRPEFNEELWWFIANQPELSFYNKDQCLARRLGSETGGFLIVARDSMVALAFVPLIQKSIREFSSSSSDRTKNSSDDETGGKGFVLGPPLTLESDCFV
ncbi:MAG: hypothetical protein ACXWP5_16875, partial [Bdellovibrionota bacterium]